MKHNWYKKDNSWYIICPITKGNFTTKLWDLNKVSKEICPCCGMNVYTEICSLQNISLNKYVEC